MIVRADGQDRREIAGGLVNEANTWTQFAGWSPDGEQAIVLRCWEDPDNYAWEREHKTFRHARGWLVDSCLVDPSSGEVKNVTAVERVSDYNSGLFFWPGDAGRLGFTALIAGKSRPFSMNLDGTDKRDLSSNDGFSYGYSTSPDGSRISYHTSDASGYTVYLADADGGNARAVKTSNPFNFAPTWSPDGQWVLFISGEHYNCHPHAVRADGSRLRRLADRGGYEGVVEVLDKPDFHSASSDVPMWLADSRWIYYTAKIDGAVELMRVSLDGKTERLSHSKPGVLHFHPQPSPDGKRVAFGSTRDGARAQYVAEADGSDCRAITGVTVGRARMHARWSPAQAGQSP